MAKTAYKILEDIFTNQINVLNIAVPTIPVDIDTAKEICIRNNFDIHLVQVSGLEDLHVYLKEFNTIRPLHDSEVISESTPILEVLGVLSEREHLFVKVKRKITHLVTRSDLDKIPVRIWLYGMISLFEIELKEKITQLDIKWEDRLTDERVEKAKVLYELKQAKNEEIDLLGCIQLGDLGTIVFKSWENFQECFPVDLTKKSIRSSFLKINNLRDALAHGQKLQMDWSEILSLVKIIAYSLNKI
jgi:hypothetical protein